MSPQTHFSNPPVLITLGVAPDNMTSSTPRPNQLLSLNLETKGK